MPVTASVFNQEPKVTLYTVSNSSGGLSVKLLDYGATLVSILFADKNKVVRDVVLGFDDLDGYQSKAIKNPFFGATVGRTCNRIGNSTFDLNGKKYQLFANNNANSLHGGQFGFDKKFWTVLSQGSNSITFEYLSPDGEEGYPGALRTQIVFTVTEQNELQIQYTAKLESSGVQTIVNLTNHSYFNLSGAYSAGTSQILDHVVRIQSNEYQEVNSVLIPTGKLLSVVGNPRDFQQPHSIGERVEEIGGYDLSYILDGNPANFRIDPSQVKKAVEVYAPQTGIKLTLSTTEPAVQFYTGKGIPAGHKVKKSQNANPESIAIGPYSAFCVEPQRFVNAVQQPPYLKQVVLSAGEQYKQTSVYKFEIAQGL